MVLSKPQPASDVTLIQIVDAALLLAHSKSGPWLACKPGCSQCCVGVFAINQLDAVRLRSGLAELFLRDGERALRVRQRAADSRARLTPEFPGEPASGMLRENTDDSEEFDSFANDEVCPVLDPASGTCDLYASRPMTCRVFGPPVRSEEGLGVCELCYRGATADQIADCEMVPDPDNLEPLLVKELGEATGVRGKTIVAFALAAPDLDLARRDRIKAETGRWGEPL
jgi:Fe-S-cluster containining protein